MELTLSTHLGPFGCPISQARKASLGEADPDRACACALRHHRSRPSSRTRPFRLVPTPLVRSTEWQAGYCASAALPASPSLADVLAARPTRSMIIRPGPASCALGGSQAKPADPSSNNPDQSKFIFM